MLNKGLLLASGGKEKLDGIWEITVAYNSPYLGATFGEDTSFGSKYGTLKRIGNFNSITCTNGSVFTEDSDGFLITGFHTYDHPNNNLLYDRIAMGGSPNPRVSCLFYVHIKKTQEITTHLITFAGGFYIGDNNNAPYMFSLSDVGKTYRMYIGPLETPPPWL